MKYRVLFSILFLFTNCLLAQNPVYRSITSQRGLPSDIVYSISQDSKEFMWFAHDKGLSRYDGKEFKTYTHPAMRGVAVTDIFEDTKGRLWCQNFTGQHFYVSDDSIHYAKTIKPNGAYYIFKEDSKGNFYCGAPKQITIYNSDLIATDSVVLQNYINSFLLINDTLYFFSNNKLYNYYNKQITVQKEFVKPEIFQHHFPLLFNNNLYTFTGTEKGILTQSNSNTSQTNYLTHSPAVLQIVSATDDSLLWLNTTSGTYCFGFDLTAARHIFPDKNISSVYRDNAGSYWFTTTDEGVLHVPSLETKLYRKQDEGITSICVEEKNQKLFAGSSTGKIYEVDFLKPQFKLYLSNQIKHTVYPLVFDKETRNLLAQKTLFSAFNNRELLFEFPYAAKEIFVLNKEQYLAAISGSITLIAKKENPILKKWRTFELNKLESKEYKSVLLDFGVRDFRARAVEYNTKTETIYAATSKGLWAINTKENHELFFNNEQIIATDLEWKGDTLCVSTFNQGLIFIVNDKVVYELNAENSTIKKAIDKLKYHKNKLWAISENRLYIISFNIDRFNVCEKAGLGNEQLKDIAFYNNTVCLATQSGIISFPENEEFPTALTLQLYIEKLFCNGTLTNKTQLQELSHKQNNLKIEFAFPFFGSAELPDIYYNINNSGWKLNEKGSRILNLLSLSPGDYMVQLKAMDDSNNQSEIKTINFSIAPAFWQTWWFSFVMFIAVASIFYSLYRYRLSLVEKQNKLLSEKIKLENELHQSVLASIKSQMNPHFIFNSLNTIQSYIYLNEKENAAHYLNKFSQLTRMVLDMSNSEKVILKDEIEALTLYLELEKMRFEESLEFKIEVTKNLDTDGIKIPSMLIQPYLENAVKHGLLHKKENRKLICSFTREGNELVVIIDDNGVGRKRSGELNAIKQNKHQSFSTEANKKRLEILNKDKKNSIAVEFIDKTDENERATGTTVILRMPITD